MVASVLAAPTIKYNLMAVWRGLTESGAATMQTRDVFLLVVGPFFFQLWRCWFLIPIAFIVIAALELLGKLTAGDDQ